MRIKVVVAFQVRVPAGKGSSHQRIGICEVLIQRLIPWVPQTPPSKVKWQESEI